MITNSNFLKSSIDENPLRSLKSKSSIDAGIQPVTQLPPANTIKTGLEKLAKTLGLTTQYKKNDVAVVSKQPIVNNQYKNAWDILFAKLHPSRQKEITKTLIDKTFGVQQYDLSFIKEVIKLAETS